MQIKTIIKTVVFGIGISMAGSAFAADTFSVDPSHTTAIFKINHMGMSDFYGRFNDISGTFVVDKDKVENSKVEIKIKADTVDTHDAKRDEHLRGPDFFSVKQFPWITFKSTSVKKTADKEFEVAGDLSIKGVSKPVVLKLTKGGEGIDPWGKYRIGFNSNLDIKRSDFGVNFMPDKLGDEVTLMLSAEGVRN